MIVFYIGQRSQTNGTYPINSYNPSSNVYCPGIHTIRVYYIITILNAHLKNKRAVLIVRHPDETGSQNCNSRPQLYFVI